MIVPLASIAYVVGARHFATVEMDCPQIEAALLTPFPKNTALFLPLLPGVCVTH
jgi:hypothetical protein